LPVDKVLFHPPRSFEALKVSAQQTDAGTLIEVIPITVGRNIYSTVGHIEIRMSDGSNHAGKIEVNPANGEMRIIRLVKGGEKKAASAPAAPPAPPPPAAVRGDPVVRPGGGKA
jgi:hypothetical protein